MKKIYKHEQLNTDFPFKIKFAEMKPFYDMGRIYHWHNYLEISYVKEGKGVYHIEDRSYELEKGDIIIINNIEPHFMEVSPPNEMHQPVLMIDPKLLYSSSTNSFEYNYLAPFFNRSGRFHNKIRNNSKHAKEIYDLLEEIVVEYLDKSSGYELMIKAKLLNVVTILFRHYASELVVSPDILKRAKNLGKIRPSIEYLNNNSSDNITLTKLSELSFMSAAYFSSFFKKTTGLSPFEYLNQLRITNALTMLRSTNNKINDIAFTCGFNNLSHFNRVFRKTTGKTPKEFKEK